MSQLYYISLVHNARVNVLIQKKKKIYCKFIFGNVNRLLLHSHFEKLNCVDSSWTTLFHSVTLCRKKKCCDDLKTEMK